MHSERTTGPLVRPYFLALLGIAAMGAALLPAQAKQASDNKQASDKTQSALEKHGSNKKQSKKPQLRGKARKALAAAAKLARVPRGSEAEFRRKAFDSAIAAYEACADRFPKNSLLVAESQFRRAQILSKLQRSRDACDAYERAAEADAKTFGARAWLEKAHVERRDKRFSEALKSYRRAIQLPGERYNGLARLWVGKTLMSLGRAADARSSFTQLAEDATVAPSLRLRAYDELAMVWVRERDADAAERVIRQAESTLAGEAAGESKAAKGLRRRLERMRSRRSLSKLRARLEGKPRQRR